jgi:flagellar hook protein FlgE
MGLASALSTALTGMSAAETQIDVIGNNLANSQTVGFKSSQAVFATQFLQTLSMGSAASETNGGTNPRQTGLGVQVAGINQDFTQGTIQISSSPSDLAIQGDGFFMVQGQQGERLYSRNGQFQLNSQMQLVNTTGQRLLGYGVDDLYRIQPTEVVPLTIPVGAEMVAQPTTEVNFEGVLTPVGDIADMAQVIQSATLGNGAVPRPDASGVNIGVAPNTSAAGVTTDNTGVGTLAAGTYQYRVALVDTSGNEAMPSGPISVTVGANGQIDLNGLPPDPLGGGYPTVNIYRTDTDGNDFFHLASVPAGSNFVDDGTLALSADPLNTNTLTGNYTYMITYHRAGETESRPSAPIGPQNVVNGRINLSDFPVPPASDGSFPDYDEIRIYRNLSGSQNSFFLVDTVAPGDHFTDNRTDAEISDLTNPDNQALDVNGPTISGNTLLTDVIRREGATYQNAFKEGTLTFQGQKGGRAMGVREFEIGAATTVQDLIDFMTSALGIQTTPPGDLDPIPGSLNMIPGESGTLEPGGYIHDGRIRFVGNNGELNALEIDLTAFRLRDTSGNISIPSLGFGVAQEARGTSAASDFMVYDSLGMPINVRVTAALESLTDTETVYRWYADSPNNMALDGVSSAVGTGLIKFDGNGNFVSATNTTVEVNRESIPSVTPLQFNLDFSGVSGLGTDKASLAATRQDGSPPGVMTRFTVGDDGTVRGVFSNGLTRDLGQIQLARFANAAGLEQRGENLYASGINTGLPIMGSPGENGIGSVMGGAVELSNADIGQDLIKLVLASTQYRGNSRVITTTQQLLEELMNMRR